MLLKEHRFRFVAGTETLLFRIEELVKGPAGWPHKFKLTLPDSLDSEAKTFYGRSCYEVAEKAANFIDCKPTDFGIDQSPHSSPRPPAFPRLTLEIEQSESD
jgi:hypothetical protein